MRTFLLVTLLSFLAPAYAQEANVREQLVVKAKKVSQELLALREKVCQLMNDGKCPSIQQAVSISQSSN